MLVFLVDNIYVVFGNKVFNHSVDVPIGTNYAPLLENLFLYSYKAEFVQRLFQDNDWKLAVSFNFTFRYISWNVHVDLSNIPYRSMQETNRTVQEVYLAEGVPYRPKRAR
jgi:hypothetical protein